MELRFFSKFVLTMIIILLFLCPIETNILINNNVIFGLNNKNQEDTNSVNKLNNVQITNNVNGNSDIVDENDFQVLVNIIKNIQMAFDNGAITIDYSIIERIQSKFAHVDFSNLNSIMENAEKYSKYQKSIMANFKVGEGTQTDNSSISSASGSSSQSFSSSQNTQQNSPNTPTSSFVSKASASTFTQAVASSVTDDFKIHNIETDEDIILLNSSSFCYNMMKVSKLQINFFKEITEENLDDLGYTLGKFYYIQHLRLYYGETKNSDSFSVMFAGIANYKLDSLDVSEFVLSKKSFSSLFESLFVSIGSLRYLRLNIYMDTSLDGGIVPYDKMLSFFNSANLLQEIELLNIAFPNTQVKNLIDTVKKLTLSSLKIDSAGLTNTESDLVLNYAAAVDNVQYISMSNNPGVLLNSGLISSINSVLKANAGKKNPILEIDFSLSSKDQQRDSLDSNFNELILQAQKNGVTLKF